MPARILPSVLLPAPFSPQSACTEPAAISSDTSLSACTPGKRLVMCSNRTADSISDASRGDAREASRGEALAPPVDHDRDDDRAADDDPLIVLIEVERADRLPNEHDEQRAERGANRAALAADE